MTGEQVAKPIVQARDLRMRLGTRADRFDLPIREFAIQPGEQVACIGPSGSGKTTLLRLIAGVIESNEGQLRVCGQDMQQLSPAAKRAQRIHKIGMVFQQLALIDYLNAVQNILLPYRLSGSLRLDAAARDRALELASTAGIGHLLNRMPTRLSQGERQRVAICRALVTQPSLLLCDEPTGNLDPANSAGIVELIQERARASDASVLFVTHDHTLLSSFDRVVEMGSLVGGVSA